MTEQKQEETWETYTSSWAASPSDRLEAFRSALEAGCVYKDPNIEAKGYDELAGYMEGFQEQMPGAGFVTRSFVSHHDSALINWDMVAGDGTVVSPGTSIGVFSESGKLVSMTGFFG